MNDERHLMELASAEPDLPEILEDYRRALDRRGGFSLTGRQQLNRDARYCYWHGQSDDGRKWKPKRGETQVRPWKGASDSRPHVVDTFCREDAALLMGVWSRNKIVVTPTESEDAQLATRLTQLLRWLKYGQMKESRREARLAASWLTECGAVAVGCWWNRELARGIEETDLESLSARAMELTQFLEAGVLPPGWDEAALRAHIELPRLVLDPSAEDRASEIFATLYGDVERDDVRQAVRDLRETGAAQFPRPYMRVNRPCIGARKLNEELFVPPETCDFDTARSVYERELLTESALRERVHSRGWDARWVEEVIETQRGNLSTEATTSVAQRFGTRAGNVGFVDTDHLFEVIHAYRRTADKRGVTGIDYTCFHPGMAGKKSSRRAPKFTYAWHGLLNYDHGQMPFTLFTTERRSRYIDDARGYGEVGNTWQGVVKASWDQNIDAASLSTVPPSFYPEGMPPEEWGPGVRLGLAGSQREQYGFFDGPQYSPMSEKVQEMVMQHANRYFGRPVPDGSNALHAQALAQALADDWMACWAMVDGQTLALMQQFAPEEIYYRVIGNENAPALRATRDEIQGEFDVSISYNVGLLNQEYVETLLKFVGSLIGIDRGGRIDTDEVIEFGFSALDPNLAARAMRPAQHAAGQELDDERNVLNSLLNGTRVDVRPGQAYQMRLQWLGEEMQRNPKLQQAYRGDETVREALDERVKQLRHQVEQQSVNAETGRLGGKPAWA